MDAEVPEWLDNDFVRACLKNDPESSSSGAVNNLRAEYLVPKGENFCSVLIRLLFTESVNKEEAKKIYVLKVLFTSGPMQDLIRELHQLEKEVDMYSRLLPAFYSIMEDCGDNTKFTCRHYLTDVAKSAIVLEDLTVKGYKVRSKRLGLDLQHCKLVLEKLALLHAVSMRYYEKNKSETIPKYYGNGSAICWDKLKVPEMIIGFLGEKSMIKKMKQFANSIRGQTAYKKQAEFLDKIADVYMNYAYDSFSTTPGNIFNAQLHGDCWNNNFLFRYDVNGNPTDVKIIDLQMAFYGSVAVDFLYFVSTCPQEDVTCERFQELVNFYHQQLINKLTMVEYEAVKPTLKQFRDEITKNISVTLYCLNGVLPVVTLEESSSKGASVQNEDHLQNVQSSTEQQCGQPTTLKKQLAILQWLEKENFIDDFLRKYA